MGEVQFICPQPAGKRPAWIETPEPRGVDMGETWTELIPQESEQAKKGSFLFFFRGLMTLSAGDDSRALWGLFMDIEKNGCFCFT